PRPPADGSAPGGARPGGGAQRRGGPEPAGRPLPPCRPSRSGGDHRLAEHSRSPAAPARGAEQMTGYRRLLAAVWNTSSLAEEPPLPLPPELELQALWFAGAFGRDFRDSAGN